MSQDQRKEGKKKILRQTKRTNKHQFDKYVGIDSSDMFHKEITVKESALPELHGGVDVYFSSFFCFWCA